MAHTIFLFLLTIIPLLTLTYANNDTESALFTLPPGTNVTTVHILDERGERNISYYESNGYAIVEGDVAYGTIDELLSNIVPTYDGNSSRRALPLDARAHSIFPTDPIWPDAIVVYKYDSPATETQVSVWINVAISRWQAKNPFLQFVRIPPSPDPVGGVLTITAYECGGCYATLGYSTGPGLVLNLQQRCGASSAGCFSNEATHEIGHVLGLVHEVKRPDSFQYVEFHCENLAGFTPCNCPPTYCGIADQFRPDNSYDHSGPYQTTSIMHYRANAFAAPSKFTLVGIGSNVVPQSNPDFPDIVDHDRICKLYKPGKCKGVCGNGIVEPENGEECDDKNNNDSDSCSNTCKIIKKEPVCVACNPTAGLNKCDITTSCISTSPGKHHCACRAGYKANTPDSHYRLPFPGQEYRVFVKPGVACDTLCDNPFGAPQDICTEVKLLSQC